MIINNVMMVRIIYCQNKRTPETDDTVMLECWNGCWLASDNMEQFLHQIKITIKKQKLKGDSGNAVV